MSLHPSVAAVRNGVRRVLAELDPDPVRQQTVLVACSGGADSLALLAATIFEGHKLEVRVIGVTVDHGLQPRSAEHAQHVVGQMAAMGADETASATVTVEGDGRGLEAAAREARYAVLEQMTDHFGASLVLLGHTRDDQAETVLLGLTRGSGGRALAGMRRGFDRYRRPLLEVSRVDTVTACQVEGIEFWEDPHNADPSFTRSRVRHRVLPMLEDELGPGVAAALARTADQLRLDSELLDDLAEQLLASVSTADGVGLDAILHEPRALITRVLRLAAAAAGARTSELFWVHVIALEDLVNGRVRGEVQLPGHVTAYLDRGRLNFRPTVVEE